MRNIPYDNAFGLELPRQVQIQRILRVMEGELTQKQRLYLHAHYFDEQSPSQIARRYGVHRSTVTRTLRRAEARLRRYLTY
ncbi:MAG: helix-turn-helix domain-containing protein [Oscillospiraceae bacterium]|nr:helix-turn-helix domain-containing protein [Oscillospiraceae bacterium]